MLETFHTITLVLLSFASFHVGLNMLFADTEPRCLYDDPGAVVLLGTIFGSQTAAALARAHEAPYARTLAWVVDGVCFLPGIFLQMTTKPEGGWFGAVPRSECDMRASGYAMVLWLMGELLTFGVGVRIAIAVGFGRNALNTLLVVVGAGILELCVGAVANQIA